MKPTTEDWNYQSMAANPLSKSPALRLLCATLLTSPILACESEDFDTEVSPAEDEYELPPVEVLEDEAAYMRSLALKRGGGEALRIDLSDPRQYEYVKHRLLLSDLTPLTAPTVFNRLEAAREAAVNGDILRGNQVCGLIVLTDGNQPQGTFTFTGLSSCFDDAAQYTFMQVCQYDQNGTLITCNADEDFGAVVAPKVVTHSQNQYQVAADAISMHVTGLGEEFYFYTTALLENTNILQLQMTHPTNLDGNPGVTLWMERSPSPGNWDYRHSFTEPCAGNFICDNNEVPQFPVYNPGTQSLVYDDTRLYMPMESTNNHVLPNGAVLNWAKVWMTLQAPGDATPPGGLCTTDFTNAEPHFFDYVPLFPGSTSKRMKIDKFAVNIGDGLWESHCVDHRANVDLHIQAQYQIGEAKRLYTWSSMGKPGFDFLQIAWGCLPPGTLIMLADGVEVPIEDIEVGDQVVADDGELLTVTELTTGEEHGHLISVEDSLGHVVTMTSAHPVPTLDQGIVAARDLAVGMLLDTDEGAAKIVSIERKPYDGEVYNLALGTPEELEEHGDRTTMLANHILVGDSNMQTDLKLEDTRKAEVARADKPIPPSLYIDYVGAQWRKLVREAEAGEVPSK